MDVQVYSVNKYYTSQLCPRCLGQMETKHGMRMRIKFCGNCKMHYHRDLAAAECIALIGYYYIEYGERPKAFTR